MSVSPPFFFGPWPTRCRHGASLSTAGEPQRDEASSGILVQRRHRRDVGNAGLPAAAKPLASEMRGGGQLRAAAHRALDVGIAGLPSPPGRREARASRRVARGSAIGRPESPAAPSRRRRALCALEPPSVARPTPAGPPSVDPARAPVLPQRLGFTLGDTDLETDPAELGSALAATAAFIAPTGPCHAAASDSRAGCPPTADSRSRAAETAQTRAIAAADLAAPGRSPSLQAAHIWCCPTRAPARAGAIAWFAACRPTLSRA